MVYTEDYYGRLIERQEELITELNECGNSNNVLSEILEIERTLTLREDM